MTRDRLDVAALAVVACVLFATFAGARDLWNPNEPIYGQAVVEMTTAGEWLVPTVNGESFGEKPILYFWLARLAVAAIGPGETALRLPSAFAGVAGVLLVYLLVLPYANRRRAWIAAAVYATTYIVFWSARTIQMDLLLATCGLSAIVAATRVIDHDWPQHRGWALAGAAAGLGFLAKGPVAIVVTVGPIAAYCLATGRPRVLLRLPVLTGAAACLAVATPWFLLLWFNGQHGILYEVLVRQNLERSVTPWDHAAPWWYFLREFWVDMAPWSLFVPLAIGLERRDDDARRLDTLACVWIAVVIVFFSIPASKRSPYILPLAPAVAVLVSGLLERFLGSVLSRGRRRLVSGILAFFGVAFVAVGAYAAVRVIPAYPAVGDVGMALGVLFAIAGASVVASLAVDRLRRFAPVVFAGCLAFLFFFASAFVLPRIDPYKSARGFAAQVNAIVPSDAPLHAYRIWKWRSGYTYYTGRRIPRIETAVELARRWNSDEPLWVVVERGMLSEFRAVVGSEIAASAEASIGSNHASLYGNAAAVGRP